MSRSPLDIDDLVERWTLLPDELDLVVRLHEPSRLVFAAWLKFYTWYGRFPRGRGELHDDAVAFLARQLKVSAGDLGLVEWSGRTAERHRATIRAHLGFRECSTADAEKLTGWLAAEVACKSAASTLSARSCWASAAGSGSSRQPKRGWSASCVRRCIRRRRRRARGCSPGCPWRW